MELILVILILVVGLLVGIATGLPVALALLISGVAAFFAGEGFDGLQFTGSMPFSKGANFTILAIPMFVFMGLLLKESGLVEAMFQMLDSWFGRVPGSLGVVVMLASGGFAAMSGSGAAAAATLGVVTAPEAKRYGYDTKLILGTLNGGASLAPLIPPSVALIVYATLTEQPITRLFAAAIFPGIILMAIMLGYIVLVALLRPSLAPRAAPVSWRTRIISLRVMPAAGSVVFIVLGGIFLGWFTPTEAASIGVLVAFAVVVIYQKFNWHTIARLAWRGSREAASTTAFVLLLVVCGFMYSHVLTFFELPQLFATKLVEANVSLWQFYVLLAVVLLVLGMFVDGITMQVITVPFMVPILLNFNVDLIWFGIFIVLFVEIGTLTPPFGIHLFILQGAMKASYSDAVRGALPFVGLWLVGVILLIIFPALATWLPPLMVR